MPKQYFQMFPKIAYDIDGDANNFKVVTDVMRRVRVKMQELSDKVIYDRYSMQDGETIESVAYKFYGSPTYHWVLLLLNNIIDPIHGLVLDGNKFNDHLNHFHCQKIQGLHEHGLDKKQN
ncbi:MAG TPA: hypothetical protein EYO37_06710, partial [Nitrospina sp.]|nr:hypothetical protein [Nitrospina sp.]